MTGNKPKIIVIVGPTGSGKTALAVALARNLSLRGVHPKPLAQEDDEAIPSGSRRRSAPRDDIHFELVSADSRQVYRGMDIGTGKDRVPDVPQHLIDIVNPDEDFTLADFLDRAKQVIADIHARGNVPIVVGGTGLYVQALVENWQVPNIAPDKKMRAELEKKSVDELRGELAAIDPKEAERLERGKRYLVRALEMWHATGRKPSALKTKNEPLYDALVIGITVPREELYRRIDVRVDEMFARGLVDEVWGLMEKYNVIARSPDSEHSERIGTTKQSREGAGILLSAFRTIGYRELMNVISSERSESRNLIRSLDSGPWRASARDDICNHTHAYARRQMTWLRRMKYVEWCRTPEEVVTKVRGFVSI